MSTPAKILVTSPLYESVIERLKVDFDVHVNADPHALERDNFKKLLTDKDGVLLVESKCIDADILANLPKLKIVSNMAVGYNNFDLDAFHAAGVTGTNTPDVLTETTADFGIALLMAAARRITEGERLLRSGGWKNWSYELLLGSEINGSTLGIIGMGRIGQAIAKRAVNGFGMQLVYHNRSRLSPKLESELNARYLSKEEILKTADHVMLVLPYTPQIHHYIGAAELALMKSSATITNIARGGIVDDKALARALREKRLAAAGLDVFEDEPRVTPELLQLENVALTPHIASSTPRTRLAMANIAADNLIAFFKTGKALNPVT